MRRSVVGNRYVKGDGLEPGQGITPPAQKAVSNAIRPEHDPWVQQHLSPVEIEALSEVRQAQQGLKSRMHDTYERGEKLKVRDSFLEAKRKQAEITPLPHSRIRRRRQMASLPVTEEPAGEVFAGGRATPLSHQEMVQKGMIAAPAKLRVQEEIVKGRAMTWQPTGEDEGVPFSPAVTGVNLQPVEPKSHTPPPPLGPSQFSSSSLLSSDPFQDDEEEQETVEVELTMTPVIRAGGNGVEGKSVPLPNEPVERLQKVSKVKPRSSKKNTVKTSSAPKKTTSKKGPAKKDKKTTSE